MIGRHPIVQAASRTSHLALAPLIAGTIRSLGGDRRAVGVLARVHVRLWQLEDQARSSRVANSTLVMVKRSIDRWNGTRHRLIDRIDASIPVLTCRSAKERRQYSETLGELVDRLIILQLKIHHARRWAVEPELSSATRLRCLERAVGLEAWWRHLYDVFLEQAADYRVGAAVLPPRAEFKMYNDRELNPVVRAEATQLSSP